MEGRQDTRMKGLFVIALKGGEALVAASLAIAFARFLGPQQFGIFAFGLAAVTLLIIPIKNGASTLLTKHFANQSSDTAAAPYALFAASLRVTLLYTGLVIAGFWIVASAFEGSSALLLGTAMFAMALPFLGAIGLFEGALRGAFRPNLAILVGTILIPLIALFAGAWTHFQVAPLDAELAIVFYVGAAFLTTLIAFALAFPILREARQKEGQQSIGLSQWWALALPFIGVTGLLVLNRQIDVLLLGLIANEESAGIFRLAAQAAILTTFGVQALNHLYAPYLARAQGHDGETVSALLRKSVELSVAVALGAFVFLAIFGRWIIEFLAGPTFLPAYPVMLVLSGANLFVAINGAAQQALIMQGKEATLIRILIASAVLAIAAHLVLIPIFGVFGAAAASAGAITFWSLAIRKAACSQWQLRFLTLAPAKTSARGEGSHDSTRSGANTE